MKDYVYLNPAEMLKICIKGTTNECKLMLVIIYYMIQKNTTVFVNNAENRELLATVGFKRTPERISTILSSMVRKKMLKREASGVFSISNSLFKNPQEDE